MSHVLARPVGKLHRSRSAQGLISEETAGVVIGQPTVICLQSDDRHEMDLYVTLPAGPKCSSIHSVYTRVRR